MEVLPMKLCTQNAVAYSALVQGYNVLGGDLNYGEVILCNSP